MSFSDPIATTVISAEIRTNDAQIESEARRVANRLNRSFNEGAGSGAVAMHQGLARALGSLTKPLANLRSGFGFLGNVIASRLPAGATTAANAISQRLGNAFGFLKQGFTQLSATASKAWTGIAGGAQAAAIAVGALAAVAVGLTKTFAGIADEQRRVELSTRALGAAMGIADSQVTAFIGNMRNLSSELGVSSNALIDSGQKFLAMGVSVERTTGLMNAVATATARTGANSQQMSRVLIGLQQIQAKNALSLQEFRGQILENIPGIFNQTRALQLMGDAMGRTTEEVKDLQEQGLVPASVAIPAIQTAIEEMNEGVDVLGLRMSTLSGVMGIVRENLNQIIGTAFQPFIEALLPTIRSFIDALKSGTGPMKGIQDSISRLGKVMGETFGNILKEILPLIPGVFDLFVTNVETWAPVIEELVKTLASVARIVIPVATGIAKMTNILVTKLGPVSEIIQQILGGLLAGGLIKAIGVFGRAMGSAGGLIGRIATPLSKFMQSLSQFAGRVAGVVTAIGVLKAPLEDIGNVAEAAANKFTGLLDKLNIIPGVSQVRKTIGFVTGEIGEFVSGLGDAETQAPETAAAVKQIIPPVESATSLLSNMNKTLQDALGKQEDLISAQKNVKEALEGVTRAKQDQIDAIQRLEDAQDDLTEANEELISIDKELALALKNRQTIIEDVGSDIRELAAAERDLARVNMRLLDIEEERLETLEKIKELSRPATVEELAAADNKLTRANIALNRAIRERDEYLQNLNKTQQSSIDLSNLSLDDLRTTLSGLRAQAQAQRSTTGQKKTQAEIDEEITELTLNVADAQTAVNEALEDREELNDRALTNAEEIEDLTERLADLELDRLDTLDQQSDKIRELDALRAGETTRAGELLEIDKEIERLTGSRRDAVKEIETATRNVRDAEGEIKTATLAIRDAELEVRDAKLEQRIKQGEILGDQKLLNTALLEQIGHNDKILGQSSKLLGLSILQNPDFLNQLLNPVIQGSPLPGDVRNVDNRVKALNPQIVADLLLNNPNALRALLRSLGISGFAEGGLITKPTLAASGEYGRHEMVLPLSKPDRVWSLMAQHLPKYPGALAAAQEALAGSTVGPLPKVVPGGNRVTRREDGPATYGQIQELLNLLREKDFGNNIEIPVGIFEKVDDKLLSRKVSRQVEKEVLDQIRRRR